MISTRTTIADLQKLLATKQVSPQEVISYYHAQLSAHNATLNCALEVFDKDELLQTSLADGPLHGIPGLVKDNICQKGRLTTAASKMLANYRAPYEATVSKRLKDAGSLSLGRANMDEFAMGASGEFSAYGPTKNPWNIKHSPGGSSAGSAAAVAAGLAPWALGTETGGSVRQPASFCGLVGLYPTYGLFSRFGLLAFCSSTDQPGPLTKTVRDNAIITSTIAGHDKYDATSLKEKPQDYTRFLTGSLPDNFKVGVLRDSLESEGVAPEVKTAFENSIRSLEKMGAQIEYISLPNIKYGISVYFVLSYAEAASNLSRYDGSLYGMRNNEADSLFEMYLKTRHDGFGDEVKRRILIGNYVLSAGQRDAYYEQAQHVRAMLRTEYEKAFREVDVLISPTAATLPFELGGVVKDPLAMYMGDYFTVPNCITGLPAISLPCGFANGLPIGMQFMGPRLSEGRLYQAAYAFEQAHDFHEQYPEL